jgi:glutamate/tyrosine decarboxylase-like PLP-dependent enzyme
MPIPTHGLPADEVLRRLQAFRAHDAPWRSGTVFAGIYDPGEEVAATVGAAYAEFLSENALYPNYFPSLLEIENDVVRSLVGLLGADQTVGNCTSGGTESILLALKTARDWARVVRPTIAAPAIVLARTAHPAFHKAAHYLGLNVALTDFDPRTFRADPAAFEHAITPDTILLVASAPCYSHGVVDPVSAIAKLAQDRGILCHVDACVGGLHLAMMRAAGYGVPDFDLRVPGVTSLSVDMHKYGYAAKNTSALLYRDRDLRRFALYACAETTGYAVINTTVLSSRSGGPLAGAWAALQVLGEDGYIRIVREVQGATRRLIDGVNSIPGLHVLGEPDMCLFAFAADSLNVFELDDALVRRGWFLQPQFRAPGTPATLHLTVNHSNVARVDALLTDLRDAVAEVRANPAVGDTDALRAEVERLMRAPGPDTFAHLAGLAGMTPGQMPTSFARINTVLDALPNQVVNMLLVEYLNSIYA